MCKLICNNISWRVGVLVCYVNCLFAYVANEFACVCVWLGLRVYVFGRS